jgi:hypothetical protein
MDNTTKQISPSRMIRAGIILAALGITCATAATRQVAIVDSRLQLAAFSLAIPSDWTFEGTFLPGPSCAPVPYAIYRAIGPDGIEEVKLLPGVSWSWGRTRQSWERDTKRNDCLEWKKEVPAADFLKYMAGVLVVDYLRDVPVPGPALAQFQEKVSQLNQSFAARTPAGQPRSFVKADKASAKVRYKVNGVAVEEELDATVFCSDMPQVLIPRGWGHIYTCTGSIIRMRAREGRLDALLPIMTAIASSPIVNQQWAQKWDAVVRAAGAEALRKGQEAEEMLLKQNAEFNAATRRGTDAALQEAREKLKVRTEIADDWCDYALDLQKRQNPNTSQVIKTSSQYTYTWVNDQTGRVFNTNNPNDNPNGRGTGNWTLQQNIR